MSEKQQFPKHIALKHYGLNSNITDKISFDLSRSPAGQKSKMQRQVF